MSFDLQMLPSKLPFECVFSVWIWITKLYVWESNIQLGKKTEGVSLMRTESEKPIYEISKIY